MAPVKDGVTRRGSTWSYVIRVSNPVTGTIRPGRRGEVLHLRWTDVDLEAGLLRFEGSTNVIDGERINGTTKGGRSRVVSIDAGTVAVLKDHQSRQEADQELAGPEWQGSGRVFTTQMGAPLYPDTVTQLMPKLSEAHNNPTTRATRGHPRHSRCPDHKGRFQPCGCTTCGTCARPCYSSKAYGCMSSPTVSDTASRR